MHGRMRRTGWLLCLLLTAGGAQGGVFHRCDDGSGVAIYQNQPCAAGHTTRATQRFDEPAAEPARKPHASRPSGARAGRHGAGRNRRSDAARGTAAPRAPREQAEISAYACRAGGAHWLQEGPCTSRGRAQPLTRDELCRRIRAGDTGAAPGENTAAGGYRRNLLRARGRC